MTTEGEDKDRLIRYLLGALPTAEAERLDELSVSDRAFAEALSAAEHDLVDAYVRSELAGDDLARFQSHYLASPLRRDKVSFARAFHEFAARSAVAASPQGSGRDTRWMLAAAVLALAVATAWLAYENTRLRRQVGNLETAGAALEQMPGSPMPAAMTAQAELARLREERDRLERELEGVTVLSVALMPQLRSAGTPPRVTPRPGITHIAFRLALEPGDYSTVRVDLLDASGGRALWSSDPIAPRSGPEGSIADATIRADVLPPGRYLLRATAAGRAGGIVGDYPFTVVRD